MRDISPASRALKSGEIFRFRDVLDDPNAKWAIDVFLSVLDKPDVPLKTSNSLAPAR
jgi:hypothetical protein